MLLIMAAIYIGLFIFNIFEKHIEKYMSVTLNTTNLLLIKYKTIRVKYQQSY